MSNEANVINRDQRTMHGSRPNNSSRPRYAQFFKCFPAAMDGGRAERRAAAVKTRFENAGLIVNPTSEQCIVSPLGFKMFGLVPWNSEDSVDKMVGPLVIPSSTSSSSGSTSTPAASSSSSSSSSTSSTN